MEKINYPLRTNIGYFLNKPIGFSREFEINFPEIFIDPDLYAKNLIGKYSFSRTREGLLLRAELEADIDSQCSRCLEPLLVHVNTKFEDLYVFEPRMKEEMDEEHVPSDGYIDLGIPFRDYLLLEIPMNSLCKPDCKGICLECGQNLNEGDCEHHHSIQFD
ncbi:MAG TPA: DUF177 domain-containing protein [Chloroflexi bacterium]|jgi:uncharacterized protein|nr:DUF177 domain-containing protein [Chloroflexota bacterium]